MATAAPARVPYAVAARALLRDTLLDGALDLLRQRTWAEITMADVAAAAGVSRQTLYSELGSRDALAQALVLREADRFVAEVEGAVEANLHDPAVAIAAGWPRVDKQAIDLLAECVVRLAISFAALPTGPAGIAGDSVATLLGP